MVQFAKGKVNSEEREYALKFFTSRKGFQEERALFREFPLALRHFMPHVVEIVENGDESLKDPFGNALPPFIVMDKGESLRDRASNPEMELFTIAQARCAIPSLRFCLPCTTGKVEQGRVR